MTTITYHHKHGEVAVDSRTTEGTLILTDDKNKFIETSFGTLVFSGTTADIELLMLHWPDYPPIDYDLDLRGLLCVRNKVYGIDFIDQHIVKETLLYNYAIGSGCEFALAAMDLGYNARDAVAYAMKRDSSTGGVVRSIKLNDCKEEVK